MSVIAQYPLHTPIVLSSAADYESFKYAVTSRHREAGGALALVLPLSSYTNDQLIVLLGLLRKSWRYLTELVGVPGDASVSLFPRSSETITTEALRQWVERFSTGTRYSTGTRNQFLAVHSSSTGLQFNLTQSVPVASVLALCIRLLNLSEWPHLFSIQFQSTTDFKRTTFDAITKLRQKGLDAAHDYVPVPVPDLCPPVAAPVVSVPPVVLSRRQAEIEASEAEIEAEIEALEAFEAAELPLPRRAVRRTRCNFCDSLPAFVLVPSAAGMRVRAECQCRRTHLDFPTQNEAAIAWNAGNRDRCLQRLPEMAEPADGIGAGEVRPARAC